MNPYLQDILTLVLKKKEMVSEDKIEELLMVLALNGGDFACKTIKEVREE